MELRQLAAFEAIVRTGSFHKAAAELLITQPAISSRLLTLEAELGTVLFERKGKAMRLSPDGAELLKYARQMVALSHGVKAMAKGLRTATSVVRIGISTVLSTEQINGIYRAAKTCFEGRPVELHIDATEHLHQALMSGQLEVSLNGRLREPSIESRYLCSYGHYWVASPGLETSSDVLRLEELPDVPIVTYGANSTTYSYIRSLLNNFGIPHSDIISCDSTLTALQIIQAGLGLGVLIGPRVAEAIENERLRELKTDIRIPPGDFMAYFHVGFAAWVELFIGTVQKQLGQQRALP